MKSLFAIGRDKYEYVDHFVGSVILGLELFLRDTKWRDFSDLYCWNLKAYVWIYLLGSNRTSWSWEFLFKCDVIRVYRALKRWG